MKFTIANALTIIDKQKAESAKKMGMTFNNLCNSCTNVEAIPKDEYEARLKTDKVAMLTELQSEIKEIDSRAGYDGNGMPTFATDYVRIIKVNEKIQEKINALKKSNTARCELCKFYRFDDWWAIGWCQNKPSIYEVRKEPGDKCEYFELKENKDEKN